MIAANWRWQGLPEVNTVEIRIPNRREDISHAAAMVQRFGIDNELSAAAMHDLAVVVDEALSNIISYGLEPGSRTEIALRMERHLEEVVLVIEDKGPPFDPLKIPSPDLTASLQARKIGGLGVHFMRSLMDDVSDSRVGGVNRLRLTKKIAT